MQTRKSYAVHYKSWRHISDSPASGYPGAFKLINIHHSVTVVKLFLHRFISEVSRYNIWKFEQIDSNSLQVIKIVHELFNCPSYTHEFPSKEMCVLQLHYITHTSRTSFPCQMFQKMFMGYLIRTSFNVPNYMMKIIDYSWEFNFSRNYVIRTILIIKDNFKNVRRLGRCPGWSESSQCAQSVAEDQMFLLADSEDWSDWADADVFAGKHSHFVGFLMRGLICVLVANIFNAKLYEPVIVWFSVCMVFKTGSVSSCGQRRLWSDWADAPADPSLR